MEDSKRLGYLSPPAPKKTLADLHRHSCIIWRVSVILIQRWIEATIPGQIGGLAGEGKLEAVERLYDQGYLRFHRTNPGIPYDLWAEVWNGHSYQRVVR